MQTPETTPDRVDDASAPEVLIPSDFYAPGSYRPMESPAFLMRRVLGSILQQADAQLAEHELTYVQWLPLYKLLVCSDATNASLARDLGMDPASVTRALDRIEYKGLLQRERSTADRRKVQLVLTEQGRAMAAKVPAVLSSVLNGHLAGFSHAECRLLVDMLHRMLHNGAALRQQQGLPDDPALADPTPESEPDLAPGAIPAPIPAPVGSPLTGSQAGSPTNSPTNSTAFPHAAQPPPPGGTGPSPPG